MARTVEGTRGTHGGQGAPVAGSLDVVWGHGTRSGQPGSEPPIQVHWYDERTVIMRQSKTLSYEAPFMYLLFGDERALLLDTGATQDPELFPLRATVDALVGEWLAGRPHEGYELVVAHSHAHGDHVAADAQFADRPHTTVVAPDVEAVRAFFGFGDAWPHGTVRFDLGGRALDVLGSPGHHESAVTFYDPRTGALLTGDTVLPGRLYVSDSPAYRATLDRLVAFASARPVTHVLGSHVEMRQGRGRDYPIGSDFQPHERPLQMTPAQLTAIRDAVAGVGDRPGVHPFDDAILYNTPTPSDVRRLLLRGRSHKALAALRPQRIARTLAGRLSPRPPVRSASSEG